MKPNIYFIGAGGIGMAALERYFLAMGAKVAGYDRTSTPLTDELRAEGVSINFDESAGTIPEPFRDPKTTLVVYTPAVPSDLPILRYFREGGFEVMKRAEVLGPSPATHARSASRAPMARPRPRRWPPISSKAAP